MGARTRFSSTRLTKDNSILIGADGIHSTVRKLILGEADPATTPRNTGWWALMTLQPYDKARNSIGEAPVDIEDAREISWISEDVFMLHNILSHGQIVQFSVCSKDDDAEGSDKWQKTVSAKDIEKIFTKADHPPHLNRAVVDVSIVLMRNDVFKQRTECLIAFVRQTRAASHLLLGTSPGTHLRRWSLGGDWRCSARDNTMAGLRGRFVY